MNKTPKSLRLHIGIFGRTNVGKSSFLNMVAGQDIAITSPVPGTTTDVVEKIMELLPVGPVVFLDTAGIDDISVLAEKRIERTKKIFDRVDIIILIVEPDLWGEYEEKIIDEANKRNTPFVIAVNKADIKYPSEEFLKMIKDKTQRIIVCSSIDLLSRDKYVDQLKKYFLEIPVESIFKEQAIIGDLIPKGGFAVLIIPIDKEAPKGRIILPQVQTIRDILDFDSSCVVVKETEYKKTLQSFKSMPDIVVCDSQVVDKMVNETPKEIKCTTFSMLFARHRGDLIESVKGVKTLDKLKQSDRILIAEACSHHAIEDDIGRIKIPKWIRDYMGFDIKIDVCSGRDYPDNLGEYKLIVHCGGCMITRREMFFRMHRAIQAGVPMTNYGVCISYIRGVLKRVLSPFPDVLKVLENS
jgi:[FeFe] hydrogenase H-cluster maturation GTPase HydF